MSPRLRVQPSIIVTGFVVGAAVGIGPSIAQAAYDAVNSDKVDGKHAVSAGASPAKRAGRLVATGATGRLPNNIIAKAPDADTLDGWDASEFARGSVIAVTVELKNHESAYLYEDDDVSVSITCLPSDAENPQGEDNLVIVNKSQSEKSDLWLDRRRGSGVAWVKMSPGQTIEALEGAPYPAPSWVDLRFATLSNDVVTLSYTLTPLIPGPEPGKYVEGCRISAHGTAS